MRNAIVLAAVLAWSTSAGAEEPPQPAEAPADAAAPDAKAEPAPQSGPSKLAPRRPAPPEPTACRTSFDSKLFDHGRHVEHLQPGRTQKVGGCGVCHDPKGKERGCWMRLHPGFSCHTCHKRIPGVEKPLLPEPKAATATP